MFCPKTQDPFVVENVNVFLSELPIHYQSECPYFLKQQNKLHLDSINEELGTSSDSEEDVWALVSYISSNNLEYKTQDLEICEFSGEEEVLNSSIVASYRDLYKQWHEDGKVMDTQKVKIETLITNNVRLMSVIFYLKHEMKTVKAE